jgi:hypothetical protein
LRFEKGISASVSKLQQLRFNEAPRRARRRLIGAFQETIHVVTIER